MKIGLSRWAVLWEPKSTILQCSWCTFVSKHGPMSQKKIVFQSTFSPLHSHSLTLRKINYIYLLIAINYSRSISCVNAYQMTGFCMSLIFTVKSTSKQTLISQAFDLVGKAEGVYDFLLSSSKLGDMNLMSNA